MKELFRKPKWLRPEINTAMYWLHIFIILFIVYTLMNWKNPHDNWLLWGLYLGLSDVVAHTILKLD